MKPALRMLLAALALIAAADTQASELMVHPTRVVFEGASRTAQIDVINSGTQTMTYRISIVNRRMSETGDFIPVDEPESDERYANDMIRFSPRQVVLEPGIAQAVRVQVRRPADLPDGEYRTHLKFEALPAARSSAADVDDEAQDDGLDIRLTAIYSVSIPLIVRQGATSATVSLSGLELRSDSGAGPALGLVIGRAGTRSVYGDLTVYMRERNGAERVVGRANGVAVYTPNDHRRVLLPLPSLATAHPSELRVTFQERPEQARRTSSEARLTVR